MTRYRLARLESLLKEEISDIIRNEIKGFDFCLTTVTRVILSGDLRHSKVYISIYGEEAVQKMAMQKLRDYSRFVRKIVGNRVRMRYTPEISFIQDKSMEEANNIFKIMNDIKKGSVKRDNQGT